VVEDFNLLPQFLPIVVINRGHHPGEVRNGATAISSPPCKTRTMKKQEVRKEKNEILVAREEKRSALVLVGLLLALNHLADPWLIWRRKFLKTLQLAEDISQTMSHDLLEALADFQACALGITQTREQLSPWTVTSPTQKLFGTQERNCSQ